MNIQGVSCIMTIQVLLNMMYNDVPSNHLPKDILNGPAHHWVYLENWVCNLKFPQHAPISWCCVGKSHFLENHFVENLSCAFGGHVMSWTSL